MKRFSVYLLMVNQLKPSLLVGSSVQETETLKMSLVLEETDVFFVRNFLVLASQATLATLASAAVLMLSFIFCKDILP